MLKAPNRLVEPAVSAAALPYRSCAVITHTPLEPWNMGGHAKVVRAALNAPAATTMLLGSPTEAWPEGVAKAAVAVHTPATVREKEGWTSLTGVGGSCGGGSTGNGDTDGRQHVGRPRGVAKRVTQPQRRGAGASAAGTTQPQKAPLCCLATPPLEQEKLLCTGLMAAAVAASEAEDRVVPMY